MGGRRFGNRTRFLVLGRGNVKNQWDLVNCSLRKLADLWLDGVGVLQRMLADAHQEYVPDQINNWAEDEND